MPAGTTPPPSRYTNGIINDTATLQRSPDSTVDSGSFGELNQVFEREKDPAEMFFEITNYLKDKYDIGKGVLVLRHEDSVLSAISTWSNGQRRGGLALNLPTDKSLFEKVIEDGNLYTESYSETFSGNFFEQKLLLEPLTRSFALHPLKFEGKVIGLLGFSSHNPMAFSLMEEGESDRLFNKFASKLSEQEQLA